MDTIRTISIIRSLANGVDPSTGLALAMDNPCQNPETIRALFAATQALEREASAAGRGHGLGPKPMPAMETSEAWSDEKDRQLCESFSGGTDIKDLARQHGCGGEEIQSRLEALGQVISSSRERVRQETALETADADGFFVFRKPLQAAAMDEQAGTAEGTREDKALVVGQPVPQHG